MTRRESRMSSEIENPLAEKRAMKTFDENLSTNIEDLQEETSIPFSIVAQLFLGSINPNGRTRRDLLRLNLKE